MSGLTQIPQNFSEAWIVFFPATGAFSYFYHIYPWALLPKAVG